MNPQDGIWKRVIKKFLPDCLNLFFAELSAQIDWSQRHEFLDKEFEEITPKSEMGKRLADLLVRVVLKNGDSQWLYLHLEVQNQLDPEFCRRMFIYNYRIFDLYGQQVVSLAILGDGSPSWRPNRFEYGLGSSKTSIEFSVAKILDYRDKMDWLHVQENHFAPVVLAHLAMLAEETPERRFQLKIQLVRDLLKKAWTLEEIREIFRFIDYRIPLPNRLENQFLDLVKELEKESKMEALLPIEEVILERGIEQGIKQGIKQGIDQGIERGELQQSKKILIKMLERKFGELSPEQLQKIQQADSVTLDAWIDRQFEADELEDVWN